MEKFKYYIEKYEFIIIIILLILVISGIIIVNYFKPKNSDSIIDIDKKFDEEVTEESKTESIRVDIKGYVAYPGVYEVENNSRVIDVINKAGGLLENSDTNYINLSKKVFDEMIIIVYSTEEIENFKESKKEIIYIENECECPDNINDACITATSIVSNTLNDNNSNVQTNKLISINTGTVDELMLLDGIGESKAKSIIEYREKNGNFKSLEEIKNVSGIGDVAYSKIKDSIKL